MLVSRGILPCLLSHLFRRGSCLLLALIEILKRKLVDIDQLPPGARNLLWNHRASQGTRRDVCFARHGGSPLLTWGTARPAHPSPLRLSWRTPPAPEQSPTQRPRAAGLPGCDAL